MLDRGAPSGFSRRIIVLGTVLAATGAAILGVFLVLLSPEPPEPPPDLTKRRICKDVGRRLTHAELCDRLRLTRAQGRDGDPRPEDLILGRCDIKEAPSGAKPGAAYVAEYQLNHPYGRPPEYPIYVDACGNSMGGVFHND